MKSLERVLADSLFRMTQTTTYPCGRRNLYFGIYHIGFLEVHSAIDVMHVTKNICCNLLNFLGVYGKSKDGKSKKGKSKKGTPKGR